MRISGTPGRIELAYETEDEKAFLQQIIDLHGLKLHEVLVFYGDSGEYEEDFPKSATIISIGRLIKKYAKRSIV